MEKKLKLFVWDGVLSCTDRIMFALAENVEQARAEILEACYYVGEDELAQPPKIYDSPIGYAIWGMGLKIK